MSFVFNPFTGTFDATTPPPDVEPYTLAADCTAGEAVGDCVYIAADAVLGVVQVRKVDVLVPAKMPAVGVIRDKPTATTCTVIYLDALEVGALPAFVPGARYFAGTSGQPVSVPPITPGALVQVIGLALESGRLLVNPSQNMTRIR